MKTVNGIADLFTHNQIGYPYLDIGLVIWPDEKGHFGLIRWGTEVMIININELMLNKGIRKDDILWYEEFLDEKKAYESIMILFTKLEALLNNRPRAAEMCDIVFPTIKSNLDHSEILQDKKLIELIKQSYETYFNGYLEGLNGMFTKYFNNRKDDIDDKE